MSIAIDFLNKISKFFVRKGNKAVMEKQIHNLLSLHVKNNKKSMAPLLENCFYNSMYFVRLKIKTRRRKKRVLYRITYLEQDKYEKKGLISFGKHTNSMAKRSQPFLSTLAQELTSLAFNKMHPIRLLRDHVHKTAFKFAPRRWFYGVKKKIWSKSKAKRSKRKLKRSRFRFKLKLSRLDLLKV